MPGQKAVVVLNPHALCVGKVVSKEQFPLQYLNWVRWNQEHPGHFKQCHRDPNILNWLLCCEQHYAYFCELSAFKEYARKLMPWNPLPVLSRGWFAEYSLRMKVNLPKDFNFILFGG